MDIRNIDFWLLISVSALCGAVLGFERQWRGKPAGIRTSILICLGTAIFIRLSAAVGDKGGDPARVLGQVVTGVGFIGAGMMLTRDRVVVGVTSAAVVWLLAAIGATVGFGYYLSAMVLSVLSVLFLAGVAYVEARIGLLPRGDGGDHRAPDE
ncbi:MAG: MgtC/SapB family protein [Anaerolineales bacterium]|nr:MgtC/SapB family protein [Anaerolineales bacterium]MCB9126965.1 MgtC/SapB family protein [Ardenticatenales bacterium]MCB9171518.1 MgtC/SapB family protein [Ardenticatenales bacterium]